MYTCVASNVAGNASHNIQLDVYSTPSISGSDIASTHDVNRGNPFSLECNVIGHPSPNIEVRFLLFPVPFIKHVLTLNFICASMISP